MELNEKLGILADAAKYDASCASSGAPARNSIGGQGIGSTQGMGICHSYAPDGRCISLLKILLTNFCTYDCRYCVNRRSSNTRRARFSVREVVTLTLEFYRRNYIEGLFLSSGIIRSPAYTMEQLIEVARQLREIHDFRGYIHLKTIPEADLELIERAGRYADRISINIELPTEAALTRFAPEKDAQGIRISMARIRGLLDERKAEPRAPRFAPAGQSTQLIIGAEPSTDATILESSQRLYATYRLRRVYYSAYSPIPDAARDLPSRPAPLMREHRLYQADWLMRFYGFEAREITNAKGTGTDATADMLDLDCDPKLAWAQRHPERFPVDLNTAPRELLLRVPGLGLRTVDRVLRARRQARLRIEDIGRMGGMLSKARAFVLAPGHRPPEAMRRERAPRQEQLALTPPPQ